MGNLKSHYDRDDEWSKSQFVKCSTIYECKFLCYCLYLQNLLEIRTAVTGLETNACTWLKPVKGAKFDR